MMKRIIFLMILGVLIFDCTLAQTPNKYSDLITEAWELYEAKEYLKSGLRYSDAFNVLGGRGLVSDRYNAACSWALANETDSSFVQLFKIAQNGNYTNLAHITTNSDLYSIHQDARWSKIIEIVKSNKEKSEAHLDKTLVAILDTIYQEDQEYRSQINAIEKKHGWESNEMKAHWKIINRKDSINLVKVKKILDEYGWLGSGVVGNQGNRTLFLVIQHSEIDTQEKYLPMMREAVKGGNASASNLALLEDRVALGRGEKQIYGSQIGRDQKTGDYYVLPLIDPDNVNERRENIGLETIQEYISNWNLIWNVEEYKKRLLESKQNK